MIMKIRDEGLQDLCNRFEEYRKKEIEEKRKLMTDQQKFFEAHKDYNITVEYYESDMRFSVEEMYQMFKQRFMEEEI